MIVNILLSLVLLLFIIHNLLNNNGKARMLKKLPGLTDHFLIGNALHFMVSPENEMESRSKRILMMLNVKNNWQTKETDTNSGTFCEGDECHTIVKNSNKNSSIVELFRLGREFADKFNGIYSVYVYSHPSVNIYNPEDIEIVTSSIKHHKKSEIYKFLRPWLKNGLLLSSGDRWQQRRKILTSAFHFNVLRQHFTVLNENAQRLVATLEQTMGEPTDVISVIAEYTLNAICETAMGTKLDGGSSAAGIAYKNAIHDIGEILCERFVRIYLYPDIIFNSTYRGKQHKKFLSVIHDFTKEVIKKRKAQVNNDQVQWPKVDDNNNNVLTNYYNYKNKSAMLDLLIAAERDGLIDGDGIQEEVDTFMFEGHDTTAAALTFFLMLLANNPSAQDKVVVELQEIFGDTTRDPTVEDCNKMTFLERCIKESMRLYPPVPFISRKLCGTVKLSDYTIPEGAFCHIHIYDLHRRADLFPDPLKFDPDRFLPENCIGRHNFAYIPFSAGPRNCIGQKFAMMEMKSALAAILRNFKLVPVTTPDDIIFKADIILRSNLPVYVKFIKRSNMSHD